MLFRHLAGDGESVEVRPFAGQFSSVTSFPDEMRDGLESRAVFIGNTGSASADFVRTPTEDTYPGVFAIISATNTILQRQAIRAIPPSISALIVVIGPLLLGLFSVRASIGWLLAVFLAVCLILFLVSIAFFRQEGVYLPVANATLATVAAMVITGTFKAGQSGRRAKVLSDSLARFVSPALLDEVNRRLDDQKEAGPPVSRREVTVIFLDLAGFTALADRSEPEEVAQLLGFYYDLVAEVVAENQGSLDKFLGDGALVYFSAPGCVDQKEARAIVAALAIRDKIRELSRARVGRGEPPLTVRCGIATGIASVGCFGSDRNAAYTLIGRVVNLGARLESAAGPDEIWMDTATAMVIRETYEVEALEPREFKGIRDPITPWRLVGGNGQDETRRATRKRPDQR